MGTTDNFDTPAFAGPLTATDTIPIISSATGRGATSTANKITQITGKFRHSNLTGNLGTLSSLGTSTTPVAGTTYFTDIVIPFPMLITGIAALNAATVGTNKWVYGLYAAAGGAVLANTALAGVLTSGANTFQEIALTSTYQVLHPGKYWIGAQLDGTTDRFRTLAAATWVDVLTKSTTGSFGTLPSLTVATTFTADVGPIVYVY